MHKKYVHSLSSSRTCFFKQRDSLLQLVCVMKLWYKIEKLLYDDFVLHVVGKTQGQQLRLILFVDLLNNYNSGLYLEAFNGSNSQEKQTKDLPLLRIL
jgi:hypothetical protein